LLDAMFYLSDTAMVGAIAKEDLLPNSIVSSNGSSFGFAPQHLHDAIIRFLGFLCCYFPPHAYPMLSSRTIPLPKAISIALRSSEPGEPELIS